MAAESLNATDTAGESLRLRERSMFSQHTLMVKEDADEDNTAAASKPKSAHHRGFRLVLILSLPWLLLKRLAVLTRLRVQRWPKYRL